MKKNIVVILFVILLCHAPLCAFSDDINWQIPVSINDFKGIWEGGIDIPIDEAVNTSIKLDMTFQYTEATSRSNAFFRISIKLDLNNFMDFMMAMPEVKMQGLSKDQIWGFMMEAINEPGVTFGKYFFTYSMTEDADDYFLDEIDGQIFFNNEKNKMLLIFDDDISQGFSEEAVHRIILTKK